MEEEIQADLLSKQPERITTALKDLRMLIEDASEWEMPPLSIKIFDKFKTVSTESQEDFMQIILNHTKFNPLLSETQIIHELMALIGRYGDKDIGYKIALEFKIAPNKISIISQAVETVLEQGVLNEEESLSGVQWFISCLIDGKKDVRDTTLKALLKGLNIPFGIQIISNVLPQMTKLERLQFETS